MNILFLCTGNSCRSQMAEGFARKFHGDKHQIYSAGTKKHGLNPYAIRVMKEKGIDLNTHSSKTTAELPDIQFERVVTVCSDAHENCPYFPGGRTVHKGFDDPPRLTKEMNKDSQDQEIMNVYRKVRDEIEEFCKDLESYLD